MHTIASDGVPLSGQMDPDLVGSTRFKARRNKGCYYGSFVVGADRTGWGLPHEIASEQRRDRRNVRYRIAALDRPVDRLRAHIADCDCAVLAIDVVIFERIAQEFVGLPSPCKHQQTARETV